MFVSCGFVRRCNFFARDFLQTIYGSDRYTKMVAASVACSAGDQATALLDSLSEGEKVQEKGYSYENELKFNLSVDKNLQNFLDKSSPNQGFSKQLIGYLNTLTMKDVCNRNNGTTNIGLSLSDADGKLLSGNYYLTNSQRMVLQLPDISSTYFYSSDKTPDLQPEAGLSSFSYDKKQFSASVSKLSELCQKAFEEGETSVDKNEEISVEDISQKADKFTITLDGSQLSELCENLASDVRDDDYFYTFLSSNYKDLVNHYGMLFMHTQSASFNKNDYRAGLNNIRESARNLKGAIKEVSFSSYISPKNEVLGQSCEISLKNSGTNKIRIDFVTKGNSKALSYSADDQEYFYYVNSAKTEQDGEIELMAKPSENQRLGLNVTYSGYRQDKFLGVPVLLGKYDISLEDPDGYLKNSLKSSNNSEDIQQIIDGLSSPSLSIENKLNNGKLISTADLSLPGAAEIRFDSTSQEKPSEKISVPEISETKSINVTNGNSNSDQSELYRNYQKSFLKFLLSAMKSHSDLSRLFQAGGITQDTLNQQIQNN